MQALVHLGHVGAVTAVLEAMLGGASMHAGRDVSRIGMRHHVVIILVPGRFLIMVLKIRVLLHLVVLPLLWVHLALIDHLKLGLTHVRVLPAVHLVGPLAHKQGSLDVLAAVVASVHVLGLLHGEGGAALVVLRHLMLHHEVILGVRLSIWIA